MQNTPISILSVFCRVYASTWISSESYQRWATGPTWNLPTEIGGIKDTRAAKKLPHILQGCELNPIGAR